MSMLSEYLKNAKRGTVGYAVKEVKKKVKEEKSKTSSKKKSSGGGGSKKTSQTTGQLPSIYDTEGAIKTDSGATILPSSPYYQTFKDVEPDTAFPTYRPPPAQSVSFAKTKSDDSGIPESPYLKYKYGGDPTIVGTQLDRIFEQKQDIKTSLKNIPSNIKSYYQNINIIKSAPSGSSFTIGEKTDLTRREAFDIIRQQDTPLKTISKVPPLVSSYGKLRKQEDLITEFYKKGWVMEQKGDQLSFRLPTATEVLEWKYPKTADEIRLGTAFIESPLGIGSAIDWTVGTLTGDKEWEKRRTEKLSKYALELTSAKEEGLGQYAFEILKSPAMVEGVYIPTLSLGAGYTISGLSAGSRGIGLGTSKLAKLGATRGGKILGTGLKTSLGGAGIVGMGATGYVLTTSALAGDLDIYEIPSMAGEIAFTFGMAYGGYKTGQKLWTKKHLGIGGTPKKPVIRDIDAKFDVLEYRYPDESIRFTAMSKGEAGGKPFDARIHGKGIKTPEGKMDVDIWGGIEQGTTGKLGSQSRTTMFKGTQLSQYLGKQGNLDITASVGKSQPLHDIYGAWGEGMSGETLSESITFSKNLGTTRPSGFNLNRITLDKLPVKTDLGWLEVDYPKQSFFESFGKYSNKLSKGDIFARGRKLTLDIGEGGIDTGASSLSSGGGLKMDYANVLQTAFGEISADIVVTAQKPTVIHTGISSVIGSSKAGGTKMSGTKKVTINIPKMDTVTVITAEGGQKVDVIKKGKVDYSLTGGQKLISDTKTKPKSIIGQIPISKPVVEYETGKGVKSILIGDLDFNLVTQESKKDQFTFKPQMFDMKPAYKEEEDFFTTSVLGSDVSQVQSQKLKLATVQGLKTTGEDVFGFEPVTFEPITPIPIIPFLPKGKGEGRIDPFKEINWQFGRKKKGRRTLVKTVLADPFSVSRSQALFGKATHPLPTKKVWSLGEKTWWRIPTVELSKKGKTKIKLNILGA